MKHLEDCFLEKHQSIREAMLRINRNSAGIVLVVDEDQRLQATITDGDIRRAVLSGVSLDQRVEELLSEKHEAPITASDASSREEQIRLMQMHAIRQLPLLDESGHVTGLTLLDELISQPALPMQAVIMAGGFGKRLRPLTDDLPKPMLPIRGQPLMERTIRRLKNAGIRTINITTHYLPEKITNYFGSGRNFGVNLKYVSEDQPLGTAGSLALVDQWNEPLLVINGDILTGVDFRSMLSFHHKHGADLTVGVRHYGVEVPYGVIEADQGVVRTLREKPTLDLLVSAGVYLLEPAVRRLIPAGQRFDMTDLIASLLEENRKVVSFPIVEYWIDIGRLDDFRRAEEDVEELRWAS